MSMLLAPLLDLGPLLGHFEYGRPNRIHFHNGSLYVGDLMYGEMHGEGQFLWPSGIRYQGAFKKNRIEGTGEMIWEDAHYRGEFKDNVRHGKGRITLSNGITYDGEWDQGKPQGKGTMIWSDSYYTGEFMNGLRYGHGEMHYPSGSIYAGQWVNGIRSGEGTMRWISGDHYSGDWVMGQMHGKGHYVWKAPRHLEIYSSKNEYEGEFQNGQRHGAGLFRYADGSYYNGEFNKNLKESELGTYKDFMGLFHTGKFIQDELKSRQYMIGAPDWEISQPSLKVELRRHFRHLLLQFRTYKKCFEYSDSLSLTRDQFWYLMFPFRKMKVHLHAVDTQLTELLGLERSSPSDVVPFDIYLKFMIKFTQCWHLLEPPDPVFVDLYATLRPSVQAVCEKHPCITLHRVVVWLYRFGCTKDLNGCIRAVVRGIPWLIQDHAVFLDYQIVSLEFLQSTYFLFSQKSTSDAEILPLEELKKKMDALFQFILRAEE